MRRGAGNAQARIGARVGVVAGGLALTVLVGAGGDATAAENARDACRQVRRATFAALSGGVGAMLRCYARAVAVGGAIDARCVAGAKAGLVRTFPDAPRCQAAGVATAEARITALADRVLMSLRRSGAASRCGARRIKAVREFAMARLAIAWRRPDGPRGPRLARTIARAERRLAHAFGRAARWQDCAGTADLETAGAIMNTFLAASLGSAADLDVVATGTVRGWVPVADPSAPLPEVRIYVDGPAGAGVHSGALVAAHAAVADHLRASRAVRNPSRYATVSEP